MGNWLQYEVKACSIEDNNWDIDNTKYVLFIDQKQKAPLTKYREGILEYFGNQGLSLLDTVFFHFLKDKEGKGGFYYTFFNVVAQRHKSQDTIEVMDVFNVLCEKIKWTHPKLGKIFPNKKTHRALPHTKILYV